MNERDPAQPQYFQPMPDQPHLYDPALAPPQPAEDSPLFANSPHPWPERTPSPLDAIFFLLLLTLGFLLSTAALGLALRVHLWGMHSFADAQNDTRVALGTQLIIYLGALLGAIPIFTVLWGKSFLAGIHWNAFVIHRRWGWLIAIAVACNLFAIVANSLLPFPQHAPIDKLFTSARDAWMLFAFGVTIAPFFEELIFRGFLLPATASAVDWCSQRLTGSGPIGTDEAGNPLWSRTAMLFASLLVSVPFALMHSAQVSDSWGPLALLYCVSITLCATRLITRSLAASTLVHAAYNLILFSIMLIQSNGFRHLDKL